MALGKDERGAIIGQSGTGKSFLARHLLGPTKRLAIIDPKRMFEFGNVEIFDNVGKILKSKPERFIYRPTEADFGNLKAYDSVYRYCYERGNMTVYTDDVVGVMDKQRYPNYLQVCYQMGRARNVAMLSAFQRPAWLPMFMVSESNKFYIFRLTMKADIKRVEECCTGYDPKRLDSRHTFCFIDINTMDTCTPVSLSPPASTRRHGE